MEIIKTRLEILAKKFSLTSPNEEAEEWVLTPEEEQVALDYAIVKAKDHFQFRHLQLGDPLEKIAEKICLIEWDKEIDRDEILKVANSNKGYEIWLQNKREEERLEEEKKKADVKALHTAKFIYNIMAWTSENEHGKPLERNDHNTHLIKTICFFLSQDPRFETELNYSFKKGLLVRGTAGIGKTFLFDCVKDNKLNPIVIINMVEIAAMIKKHGEFFLPQSEKILYLDDVGTEESVINHYGTKINFFKDFIETAYMQPEKFSRIIVSTNNNFQEIEDKYGFRVRSRIKDMFNIVNVTGNDMRG